MLIGSTQELQKTVYTNLKVVLSYQIDVNATQCIFVLHSTHDLIVQTL